MKYITPITAMLAIVLITGECFAEPPGRSKGAKGESGQRREGKGQRPGAGGGRDPAQMVARMMKEFDKDGDSKLDLRELTAMMTSMRERRANGQQGPRDGRKPGAGKKPGQGKDGKGRQAGNGPAGGAKPKRPAAE